MDYTKSKGNITELTCLMGFMSMGFDCSIPYGDCARYDMIASRLVILLGMVYEI
jgi:hypothetical protein